MRAFLGRTAFYFLPFLITTIGFSLLALWFVNLPPDEDDPFGFPELGPWLAFTLLIGLPGMGTLCAIVGTRTKQRGRALVAGLAGIVVFVAISFAVITRDYAAVVWSLEWSLVVSAPFLVGFGVTALLLRRR